LEISEEPERPERKVRNVGICTFPMTKCLSLQPSQLNVI